MYNFLNNCLAKSIYRWRKRNLSNAIFPQLIFFNLRNGTEEVSQTQGLKISILKFVGWDRCIFSSWIFLPNFRSALTFAICVVRNLRFCRNIRFGESFWLIKTAVSDDQYCESYRELKFEYWYFQPLGFRNLLGTISQIKKFELWKNIITQISLPPPIKRHSHNCPSLIIN